MLDYDALMAREFTPVEQTYTQKDRILYALGLGLGTDPLNPAHLRATYEGAEGFCALPAMVNVLTYPGFWAMEPDTGITWQQLLHGEQSLTLHAPLPDSGTLIVTVAGTSFARGDGGFGGPSGPVKPVHTLPDGAPDATHDHKTPEGAALKHLQLRFSSPVYPGETIRTEMWKNGDDISFRARVVERDVVVLNNGLARLG